MTALYRGPNRRYFSYVCIGEADQHGDRCGAVPGASIDAAIETQFLEAMVPDELELCLAVERQVVTNAQDLDRAWQTRIEQARYHARRAERQYQAVDPDNRVVARSLERNWEMALRALEELEREHEQAQREKRVELSDDDRRQIRALAKDLPSVWRAATTRPADRKAMLRIAIEAISLRRVEVPRRSTLLHIAWKSGQVIEIEVPRPHRTQRLRTQPDVVHRLRELAAAGLRDEQIADALRAEGAVTGKGKSWTPWAVKWARRKEGIERRCPDLPRRPPLPERHPDGRYSVRGAAKALGITVTQVRSRMARGFLDCVQSSFGPYPKVYWIRLDKLEVRRRTAARSPTPRKR
jgi:hypothetical protein